MPFFSVANQVGGKLITKSSVVQGKQGNCYIVAAIAAYSLCLHNQPAPSIEDVSKQVGYGMGGNSKRTFEAMGLYAFSKDDAYKHIWRRLITDAVDSLFPVTLGISWETLDGKLPRKKGNHVIYVTGYEGDSVYARDQQNDQVLISIKMHDPWVSEEFVAGKRTSRVCTLTWVCVGCPTKQDAEDMLAG